MNFYAPFCVVFTKILCTFMQKMNNELKIQRDDDIYAAFMQMLKAVTRKQACLVSLRKLACSAAGLPAPRYYVTLDRARSAVCALERGDSAWFKNRMSAEMYSEIRDRMLENMRNGMRKTEAIAEAIQSPASSFFISGDHASRIIYRKMRT